MENKTEREIEILSVLGAYRLAGNLIATLESISLGIVIGAVKPLREEDLRDLAYTLADTKEQLKYIEKHIEILKRRYNTEEPK